MLRRQQARTVKCRHKETNSATPGGSFLVHDRDHEGKAEILEQRGANLQVIQSVSRYSKIVAF